MSLNRLPRILAGWGALALAPLILASACLARLRRRRNGQATRIVWGSDPVINYSYWARAIRAAGYDSETFTNGVYGVINQRADWDRVVQEEYPLLPGRLKLVWAFICALFRYDVFVLSFNGFMLGHSPLWRVHALSLRLAGRKTVLLPYGSDYFVYRRLRSTTLLHGLLMSYPALARSQDETARRLDYWCRHADVVIPGMMGPDGSGRWDVLAPSSLCIDLDRWQPSKRHSDADGRGSTVFVAHAPNHRGFKGSEFVIDAVRRLQEEGLKVDLLLMEGIQNTEVQRLLHEDTDILVEQLIATGHGFNGVEGMATGLPVVANLEDDGFTLPFRRWSFLSECPIVSASPENLQERLRTLVTRPELRRELGKASRAYAEKYHGPKAAQDLFRAVLNHLDGEPVRLLHLYHPLLGELGRDAPRVRHPLVNNRIVDP